LKKQKVTCPIFEPWLLFYETSSLVLYQPPSLNMKVVRCHIFMERSGLIHQVPAGVLVESHWVCFLNDLSSRPFVDINAWESKWLYLTLFHVGKFLLCVGCTRPAGLVRGYTRCPRCGPQIPERILEGKKV